MKEKIGNGEASGSMPAAVYAVIGEPAIVINGVPNVSSVTSGKTHFDAQRDMESEIDPLFGGWLVGRKVRKLFGNQYYSGDVVKYDAEFNWYRVVYEDGDCEDLEWHELEEILAPLDISIPLTTLALQRSRSYDTSVSWSDEKTSKSKRSLGFQKTLHFLQEPQPCELKGKDIVELNVMDENTQERTIKSKRRSDTKDFLEHEQA
ncbi:hypothetical protein J5N97_006070 [Dioscorea zingiberensis]|uniref:PTM/DIR17-like Tudor domain-containing protein n=1 Tax=Dioscorea zingiberensis TaxID=325984 RepID=A0A9D5DAW4_9LILI|nr:hypothetical protein J5N97_006070 [Dioscorea zingiberensis]